MIYFHIFLSRPDKSEALLGTTRQITADHQWSGDHRVRIVGLSSWMRKCLVSPCIHLSHLSSSQLSSTPSPPHMPPLSCLLTICLHILSFHLFILLYSATACLQPRRLHQDKSHKTTLTLLWTSVISLLKFVNCTIAIKICLWNKSQPVLLQTSESFHQLTKILCYQSYPYYLL